MALFAIADLHLPIGVNKPMDIFGPSWEGYVGKLYENWNRIVSKDDVVIVAGDISWATYLSEAKKDFEFLHELNGTKLLSKGNHDYWWSTLTKLNAFASENGFFDLFFLHNNFFMYGEVAVCAARGWNISEGEDDDARIYQREQARLCLSIEAALRQKPKDIIVALHYPPLGAFGEILTRYGVRTCVFGHLHGIGAANTDYESERDILVAADHLNFAPKKIME